MHQLVRPKSFFPVMLNVAEGLWELMVAGCGDLTPTPVRGFRRERRGFVKLQKTKYTQARDERLMVFNLSG